MVEPRGVEPLTRQCHCRVIPLHYGPIQFYLLTEVILEYKISGVNIYCRSGDEA